MSYRNAAILRGLTLEGVYTPPELAANTNNFDMPDWATVVRFSASGAVDLTGLKGGRKGRVVMVLNTSANTITIKDEVTSIAANRFALTGDFSLATDVVALLWYDVDSARWRKI